MEHARVVLVTNVGQGFGRAVALAFGQAGYDVVCADADVASATKTAAEVEELGAQAIPVQADVSDGLDVRGGFAKVYEIFGALSGVVHVATHLSHTPFTRLTETEFAELLRENVTSTYLVLREASRHGGASWAVVVTPPRGLAGPQMAAIHGAISGMAAAFAGGAAPARGELLDFAELADPEPLHHRRPRVNVVVPSRGPSDPRHDARLANAVRYLGSAASIGITGTTVDVELPPPPRVVETLLPEVRAALDDTMRQDDRTAPRDGDGVAFGDDELEGELVGRARPGVGGGAGGHTLGRDGDDDEPFEDGPYDDDVDGAAADALVDDADAALEDEGLDDDAIGASVRALARVEGRDPYAPELGRVSTRRRGSGR